MSALDQPGEWFLDREGTLYYMPREGEDMATAEVIAPVSAESFITFAGEPEIVKPSLEALLDRLWAHATQEAFAWCHRWRVGDLLL